MSKYLDSNGLLYLWGKIKELFVAKETGKGLSSNDYTTAEKEKLSGIETGANNYTLPKASTIGLGGMIVGDNLTVDASGRVSAMQGNYTLPTASASTLGGVKIGENLVMNGDVLSAVGSNYSAATTSSAGLMSAADKTKLNGIEDGATNTVVDSALSSSSVNPVQNKIVYAALGGKVDTVSGKGLSTNDYTTSEKNKLSGIAYNANNYSLPTAGTNALGGVKTTSTVSSTTGLTAAPIISGNVYYKDTTYSEVTTSSSGLMSASDKSKLNAFSDAANYALKSDIVNMYKYKGSVASFALLPTTGNTAGDVYNVETDGQNYAWNGTEWDSLGEIFTITDITNSDIDTIVAS